MLQPLKAIRIEPSAQNGENRFIIGSGRMHVFLQKIPGAGFMSPPLCLWHLFSYRFNRVGRNRRRCLLAQVSTQAESLTPIDFQTDGAWENSPGNVVAGRSVKTNFAGMALTKI